MGKPRRIADLLADTGDVKSEHLDNVSGHTPEGTAVKSTGETGGTKYLREDGDDTCSWQTVAAGMDDVSGVARATSGLLFNGDTAAANVLDDYEEGTWTPTFILRDTTYGSTSYSNQDGYYTKIGNEVFVSCYCRFSAWSGGSNNEVRITGLPFTNANTTGGVMPLYGSNPTKRASLGAWATGTAVELYYNNGTTFGNLVRDDFAQNTYVRLTTTYNV
jgi:hypothetical protein